MEQIKQRGIALFICFFIAYSAYSQLGGRSTYAFLQLTNSARVAALGGNNITVNDSDLNLAYHNPALLNKSVDNNIVFNYVGYFADIFFGYVGYAKSFEDIGTIGAGIHHINYGAFNETNESGDWIGIFSAEEYAINLMYSKVFLDSSLTVGLNCKPVISNFEKYSSYGILADLGLNYYMKEHLLSISFVLRNMGSQIKPYIEGNYEPVPFDIEFGVSKRLAHAPFRFSLTAQHLQMWDYTYKTETDIEKEENELLYSNSVKKESKFDDFSDKLLRHMIIGVEFLPSNNFFVAFGYNHQRRKEMAVDAKSVMNGFSWGAGIRILKCKISYGRAIYHVAGASNHFSIAVNLNEYIKKRKS